MLKSSWKRWPTNCQRFPSASWSRFRSTHQNCKPLSRLPSLSPSLSLSLSFPSILWHEISAESAETRPREHGISKELAQREKRNAANYLSTIQLSLSLSLYRSYRSFFSNHTRVWGKGGEEMAWARSDRRFTRVINRSSYIAPSKNLGETPNQTFRDSRLFLSVFFFFFFFWSLVAVIHRGTIWIKIWKTDGPFKRRDDFYYFYEGRGFIIETVLTRYKRLEMWSIILVSIKKKERSWIYILILNPGI